MDQINSNPFFNSARLYQNLQSQQKAANPIESSKHAISATSLPTEPLSSRNEYSTMFDDDALLKLQGNLEAIAQLAEQSLKRLDS